MRLRILICAQTCRIPQIDLLIFCNYLCTVHHEILSSLVYFMNNFIQRLLRENRGKRNKCEIGKHEGTQTHKKENKLKCPIKSKTQKKKIQKFIRKCSHDHGHSTAHTYSYSLLVQYKRSLISIYSSYISIMFSLVLELFILSCFTAPSAHCTGIFSVVAFAASNRSNMELALDKRI